MGMILAFILLERDIKGGVVSNFKIGSQTIAHTINGNYPQASTYLDYIQNRKGTRTEDQRQLFDTADEKMKRIHDIIWQVSGTNVPVLITGEAGVGKKMVARAIHEASIFHDARKIFTGIDCSSMSASVLEKELFGFETDPISGSSNYQPGKFEIASNGTILLNEITDTDLSIQTKLLRILQEQLIERSGTRPSIPVSARVIATTSKDIVKAVSSGKFRQDLYYRLYVLHLEIPPLRNRPKDIALLATKFVQDCGKVFNKPNMSITDSALDKLKRHHWPNNVTELSNVIERAVMQNMSNTLEPENIPLDGDEIRPHSLEWVSSLPIGQTLHLVETHFILKTLAFHSGNRTHAAKSLGISLRTLRNKINEFTAAGFEVPTPLLGKASS
jgi:DNA-binding NtrC family response regulator